MGRMYRATTALALIAIASLATTPATIRAGSPIGDKFLIHNTENLDETRSSVAYNSQNREYLVVWGTEPDDAVQEVWGQRLSRSGALLDSAFRISPADGGYNPDVTYNGAANEYLVVWETGSSDIRGQRLSSTGVWVGDEIFIATGYNHGAFHYHQPSVAYASAADRYLVTFQYVWDLDSGTGIQARAYLSDGTPEDYAFEIAPTSSTTLPELADLAYSSPRNEYLIVWQQTYAADNRDIYGRRVTLSGGASVLGDSFEIATTGADEVAASVAAVPALPNESHYLIAWQSDKNILARTLSGAGAMGFGPLRTLADTAWSEYTPSVAGCESSQQFLVTWTWLPVVTPPAMSQVQARTLALDGSLFEATRTNIGGGYARDPAVASGPSGDFLIVFDDNVVFGTYARGIYGYLWGDRVYLPVISRN